MGEAFQAWQAGNIDRAEKMLHACRDQLDEENRRGIDLRLLQSLIDDSRPTATWVFEGLVESFAFSADNRFLAVGLANGAVLVHELGTERPEILVSAGEAERAYCVAFSPDSAFLLAGRGRSDSYGEVLLWQVTNGAEPQFVNKATLGTHDAPVGAVAAYLGPSGLTAASADLDGTLMSWLLPSGDLLGSEHVKIPVEHAERVAFTADGQSLAFDCGKRVLVWGEYGRVLRSDLQADTLPLSGGRAAWAPWVLSPDGNSLAYESGFTVRLAKFGERETQTMDTPICWDRRFSLAFSSDGTLLAMGGDGGRPFVTLLDIRRGRDTGKLIHGGLVSGIAISSDGRWLASADWDLNVKLWDLNTLKRSCLLIEEDWLQPLALSPDGKTVACRGQNHAVLLWDTATGDTGLLSGHTDTVRGLAFSPDGKTLASASLDRSIRVWDVRTRQCIDTLNTHRQVVYSVAFTARDGTRLAAGGRSGDLWLWDRNTGEKTEVAGHRADACVCTLKASPDFRYLVSGTVWAGDANGRDNEAIVWDISGPKPVKIRDPLRCQAVSSIGFSLDGCFALGENSSSVQVRRLNDLAERTTLTGEGTWLTGVSFSPDGEYAVTAGSSGEIRVFRDWERIGDRQEAIVIRTEDRLRRIEFFPDGEAFVTGGMDGYIRVWRLDGHVSQTGG